MHSVPRLPVRTNGCASDARARSRSHPRSARASGDLRLQCAPMPEPTHCSRCRAALPPAARFCPSCGARSGDEVAATLLAATELDRDPEARPRARLPPMRLEPGTALSVSRIESIIGEGGMGVVYRGHDEALDRQVAIKCLHTNLAGDSQIRRRFAREARVLREWTHPNVVSIFDFVEQEHLLAIV